MIRVNQRFKIIILMILFFISNLSVVCLAVTSEGSFFTLTEVSPEIKNESIIDTRVTKELSFNILNSSKEIFYNNEKISTTENNFKVDISNLSGVQNFEFHDEEGSNILFTYYLSDSNGKLEDYELVKGKDLESYVVTFSGIKIIYTTKEKKEVIKLCILLQNLPKSFLQNLTQIQLVPYKNSSNIAGTTKGDKIILYKFSSYELATQKNIIYHEITHTWASNLMNKNLLDKDYSDYRVVVNKDNNYVTKYSKDFALSHNGKLSEDFAEGFAFYFIDKDDFKNEFPNRYEYITELLKNEN